MENNATVQHYLMQLVFVFFIVLHANIEGSRVLEFFCPICHKFEMWNKLFKLYALFSGNYVNNSRYDEGEQEAEAWNLNI